MLTCPFPGSASHCLAIPTPIAAPPPPHAGRQAAAAVQLAPDQRTKKEAKLITDREVAAEAGTSGRHKVGTRNYFSKCGGQDGGAQAGCYGVQGGQVPPDAGLPRVQQLSVLRRCAQRCSGSGCFLVWEFPGCLGLRGAVDFKWPRPTN